MKYIILGPLFMASSIYAQDSKPTFYDIAINNIYDEPMDLSQYAGKYILIVNVASKCGFTKQYADLQQLYDTYGDKLVVIGAPCNQFGKQEPGTAEEIVTFCSSKFDVTFPLTVKLDVKGDGQHPLFQWLTSKELNGVAEANIKWNFNKFLIGPDGQWIDHFGSMVKPMSDKITAHFAE